MNRYAPINEDKSKLACYFEEIRLRKLDPETMVIPTVSCPGWTLNQNGISAKELAEAYESVQ